jgi:uncharacterized protein (TIGR03067 family)
MRWYGFVAAVVGLMVVAGEPRGQTPDKDKALLKGTWSVITFEVNGKEIPSDQIRRFELIVDEQTMTIKANVQERESTYKLDPKKNPKAIDLIHKDKVTLGIYQVDEKRLQICLAAEGNKKRPTEFTAPRGSEQTYMKLRREK